MSLICWVFRIDDIKREEESFFCEGKCCICAECLSISRLHDNWSFENSVSTRSEIGSEICSHCCSSDMEIIYTICRYFSFPCDISDTTIKLSFECSISIICVIESNSKLTCRESNIKRFYTRSFSS